MLKDFEVGVQGLLDLTLLCVFLVESRHWHRGARVCNGVLHGDGEEVQESSAVCVTI